MIANLPLLFSNGNPTALSKITAVELEKFITFMVTCSWGHDTAREIRQPVWWPQDVAFSHPFVRPKVVPKDWEAKLKNLVRKCYDFHKSAFLLVFSAQLSRHPRKRLRYVDNRDHTTSLYFRPSGRLLVTFRNENLFYDGYQNPDMLQSTVQQELIPADIYLCDHCDSHFDNIETLNVHEKLCNREDIGSSEPTNGGLLEFLTALRLQPIRDKVETHSEDVNTVRTRQVRSAAYADRGPSYPFSSLAGLRNAKSNGLRDTSHSRERVERYCCNAPSPLIGKPKSGAFSKNNQFPIRYRRPIDYWNRHQTFPYQRNKEILDLKGQLLTLKCRPLRVAVENMSLESMERYMEDLKQAALLRPKVSPVAKDIEFVSENACDPFVEIEPQKVDDPLNRGAENATEDVIDLCSDEETSSVNENCDPRAGVACVVRGGAVLRRTAATPYALPAEPCGARQRPHIRAVLKSHPVILFAQSLSNMQIIAID